mgnify:CR=1 FL=1
MEFKVLAVGDVVGNPGLERVRRHLRQLKRKCNADFVIVNGENAAVVGITPNQAEDILDAGADVIIGGHSHCLQGMEFYNGKPIAYSVGNFWFSSYTLDSCVVTLRVDNNMNVETVFVPLIQEGCETRLLKGEERREYLDKIESFEPQAVKISDDGIVTPA